MKGVYGLCCGRRLIIFPRIEDMRLMEVKRGTGDRFTVRYGVLTHHFGKDSVHDLPMEV